MAIKKKNSASTKAHPAPVRVDSTRDLADLQRSVWQLISRPLAPGNRMQKRAADGRATSTVVGEIIKPNDRLTSFERLEIYNRMYWFRVLDSLYEDCPGLRAVLGDKQFMRLIEAYMIKYPSRSFTLRNLPDRLAQFIKEEPRWTRPHAKLCYDLARFEWAQIEVYDGAALPLFTIDDLLDANPEKLRLSLQPYLQLLEVGYPVDDYLITIKKRAALLRGDASNAPTGVSKSRRSRVARPKPGRRQIAVHRFGGIIYFKRLEPAACKVLLAIQAGQPLAQALATGLPRSNQGREAWAIKVQGWFKNWMELGWFCRR